MLRAAGPESAALLLSAERAVDPAPPQPAVLSEVEVELPPRLQWLQVHPLRGAEQDSQGSEVRAAARMDSS